MNDDEIVAALRRAAADGAKPVAIADRLGEMVGGLTLDAFLFFMRRAFPGIPDDVLFGRATAWLRVGEPGTRDRTSDGDIDRLLERWISGQSQMQVLELEVVRADRVGNGEMLADGRCRIVPTFGDAGDGDDFAIVVVDGITAAVFQNEHEVDTAHRARMTASRPRWLDTYVFVDGLRESERSVTFNVRGDGAVITALACFAATTALVTGGHREVDPIIATDPRGREHSVHIRATPSFEHGWCGSVEWDAA